MRLFQQVCYQKKAIGKSIASNIDYSLYDIEAERRALMSDFSEFMVERRSLDYLLKKGQELSTRSIKQ
jgi:hypothetical protein